VIENKSMRAIEEVPEVREATPPGPDYGLELPKGPNYVVKPGDTLYSVAFRLGMDHRTLAEFNDIDPPFVIRVGQSLTTAPTATQPAVEQKPAAADAKPTVVSADRAPPPTEPTTDKGDEQIASGPPSHALSTAKAAPSNVPVDRWLWPVMGEVIRAFSDERHKGINLAGERGSPIGATAAGVVVYAGTGVTGYGALLIIKHNDTYLSAYGHNDELLAVEGERVEAGQIIARMGSTSSDSVKLHFEIRRNGRPVNPVALLPAR
jgi:lipoprotein NlpD